MSSAEGTSMTLVDGGIDLYQVLSPASTASANSLHRLNYHYTHSFVTHSQQPPIHHSVTHDSLGRWPPSHPLYTQKVGELSNVKSKVVEGGIFGKLKWTLFRK